ncbi:triose-phosphate isomerase [Blastococcus brunescens]|uniref:Triose-phosphate isomerase n=1 Tax=Blastococcus brunescens TaxID=1564165 RepID=A0ABZ1AUU1_9ACTN|nr:triose-phosphate isomerase [Blastococcus sp. BMG 8361]WRL61907.1 triose-phosphate isomerase [Blastococcus sp. BMG 8361]
MNMTHLEAIGLVQKLAFTIRGPVLDTAEVVVLPPFTALRSVQTLVTGDKLDVGFGAQDLSAHDSGAYTGEVSGAMLAALACQYVTVGHPSAAPCTPRTMPSSPPRRRPPCATGSSRSCASGRGWRSVRRRSTSCTARHSWTPRWRG